MYIQIIELQLITCACICIYIHTLYICICGRTYQCIVVLHTFTTSETNQYIYINTYTYSPSVCSSCRLFVGYKEIIHTLHV